MGGFRSPVFLFGLAMGPARAPAVFGEAPSGLVVALVGDAQGRLLGELRAELGGASWEYDGPGGASLTVGRRGMTEAMLRFGNRVLLHFGNGLPDWVGVLTGAREWSGSGVKVQAAGLRSLLARRVTGAEQRYEAVGVDVIIGDMLALVSGLAVDVFPGTTVGVTGVWNYAQVDEVVERALLVEDWLMDVRGALTGDVIGGVARVYKRRSRRSEALIVEGHNLGDGASYREEDFGANVVHVVGAGEGWTAETRAMTTVMDEVSVAMFGERETTVFVDEIDSVAALEAIGLTTLARLGRTRRAIQAGALDRTPGRFGQYGMGDMARVLGPGLGLGVDGWFELVGREFKGGECTMVLEGVD